MSSVKQRLISFLRWSERYTKTDMLYLVKGSFWLNLATGLNTLILLGLLYAFGNFVSPELYGQYRYFLSVYGTITVISLAGFNTALTRSVAKGYHGDLIRGLMFQAAGCLIGSIISFGGAGYYWLHGNTELSFGFLIMGLAMPFMESLDLYTAFFVGKKMFEEVAATAIASQLLTTVALVIAIALHVSVIPILITYFLSWVVVKGVCFWFALQYRENNNRSPDFNSIGLNFSAIGALSNAANYLDRIVLFHYMGARDVALYSFAIAPTEQLKALFKNASSLIFPKFSMRTEEDVNSTVLQKTLLMGAAALLLALLYIIAAPVLITFFLPKYTEIIFHSQVYALSLIGVMIIPLTAAMNSIPKIKALYLTNIITPLISVVLIVTLIPPYGLWGAIAARALGRIFSILATYLIFYLS